MLIWLKENMGGWNKYRSGLFTIEKEVSKSYSVWYGHHDIGEASSIAEAKKIARRYARQYRLEDTTQ